MATAATRTAYNFLFPPLFALSLPYYFLRMRRRGNWRNGLAQRFGRYGESVAQSVADRNVLWMHAVSVGEINVCVELLRTLDQLAPETKFVVSTTTTTGMGELEAKAPAHVTKIYYPIDRSAYVQRALNTIKPKAIVLLEGEIWPNFVWQAQKLKVPMFLANARVSDRSHPRYRKLNFLFRDLFASLTAVGAQSEEYASRLREVGCRPERVEVLGNLKFDAAKLHPGKVIDVPGLLAQLGIAGDALLLVAGSTHDGEEEILAREFMHLRRQFPKFFLILVPRHQERRLQVGRMLAKLGLKFFYRSEITSETRLKAGSIDSLVVDTTGELMNLYEHASIVFVGKSLASKGGQNPIEPAALGRPVVFGSRMQNFTDVARLFVSQHGAIQVRNANELGATLGDLLANPARREELGRTASRVVKENQGAVLRTARMILQHCALVCAK